MGWRAINKQNEEFVEDKDGRPVQAGEDGNLLVIAQEDYGHTVAVDLIHGIVAIDYESLGVQNGTIELRSPKLIFYICEETNVVGEFKHLTQELVQWVDPETKEPQVQPDGSPSLVRNDILKDLVWRPIWFSRVTNGVATKVIGAQTTTPPEMGGKNVKKLISLFADGRVGID